MPLIGVNKNFSSDQVMIAPSRNEYIFDVLRAWKVASKVYVPLTIYQPFERIRRHISFFADILVLPL